MAAASKLAPPLAAEGSGRADSLFAESLSIASLPASVLLVDAEGRVLAANDRCCELTGYGRAELLSLRVTDLLDIAFGAAPPADAEHEAVLRRKGGEVRWVHLQCAPLADPGGAPAGALFLARDITDRKRSEETKEKLQQRISVVAREWQLTFDAVSSPILLLDLKCKVLRLNRAAMELSGRTYAENLSQPVAGAGPGEPWRTAAELARRVIATGRSAQRSVEDAAGGRTWDITASLVAREDRENSVIVVAKDVSELVALQRSLRKSELMSALGSLVAGVAHEVRNPLFAMSATLDAFEACNGADSGFGEYFGILRDELARMSDLMRDLLEYGRPVDRHLVPGSICRAIAQAVEACQVLAQKSQVEIAVSIAEGLPQLLLDEPRMVQVFKNLSENAIQHSAPGGRVEIEARCVDSAVECTVHDRGRGFREEDLPYLFEPFFSRRRGGTGLGLALVQRIVVEHGGEVTCRNHPAGGALVKLRLPTLSAGTGEGS